MLKRSHAGIYLGVDGGSSGTRALLITGNGTILGAGEGGNANHAGQGYASAVAHVLDAVQQALAAAKIPLEQLEAAHFALAGDDVDDDHQRLCVLLSQHLGAVPYRLTNDVWAGLRAGSLEGYGIAVNCGSGTGAVGASAGGDRIMIPDLGYVFGDSGGGTRLGETAVRMVIRAWDGRGSATALTDAVLTLTALPSVDALYLALYRGQVGQAVYRKATRLVFEAAAKGDAVAVAILRQCGDELGVSACALARRLGLQEAAIPFVLTGGAIRTLQSPLVDAAVERLRTVVPRCRPTLPLLMPVAGAALLALELAGVPVGGSHFASLRAQGQSWHAEELFT